ncbi:MAG: hypothetical protein DHS20C11_29720 [Lysobacteraceae bacterium]|nr:MAG: hypothetical protein DHS20C11_29720 [Xanthomonadaceae bacterium]
MTPNSGLAREGAKFANAVNKEWHALWFYQAQINRRSDATISLSQANWPIHLRHSGIRATVFQHIMCPIRFSANFAPSRATLVMPQSGLTGPPYLLVIIFESSHCEPGRTVVRLEKQDKTASSRPTLDSGSSPE